MWPTCKVVDVVSYYLDDVLQRFCFAVVPCILIKLIKMLYQYFWWCDRYVRLPTQIVSCSAYETTPILQLCIACIAEVVSNTIVKIGFNDPIHPICHFSSFGWLLQYIPYRCTYSIQLSGINELGPVRKVDGGRRRQLPVAFINHTQHVPNCRWRRGRAAACRVCVCRLCTLSFNSSNYILHKVYTESKNTK
jgi:hypothetical protein